ncbi:phosphodiester glycosidase family protein [Enterococcus hirae]|nr:phosphodiester glycosidase family protein [Enterococcus hirae]
MIYEELWIDINKFESGYAVSARQNEQIAQVRVIVTNQGKRVDNSRYSLHFTGKNAKGEFTDGYAEKLAEEGAYLYTFSRANLSVSGKFREAYFRLLDTANREISSASFYMKVYEATDLSPDQATVHVALLDEILEKYQKYMSISKDDFDKYSDAQKKEWTDFIAANKDIIGTIDPGGTVLKEIGEARAGHESLKGKLEASSNSAYIDDVNQWNRYDDEAKTNYFVTEIPPGTKIKQFFHDHGQQKTARETDRIIGTATVVMNAGMTANAELSGLYIHDGKVICENEFLPNYWILAWNAKNEWSYYKNGTATADQIIADGFDQAITAFTPLIWNGRRHEEGIKIYQDGIPDTVKNPHQIIAIKADGTILTVCCDGRDIVGSNGWNCTDAVRILLSLDVDKAFMLDGGGSTQTVVRGIQVNHNHDNSGKAERAMRHYLYFEKDIKDEKNKLQLEDIKVSQFTGKLGKRVSDAEVDLYKVQANFKNYNPNIMPWLTENTDLLSLPAGVYEGTRPKYGLPDASVYIYQIYQSKISPRKMIKATRSFDGAIFNRTIHSEGILSSGTGGWKRIYPAEEVLFLGGASLEQPTINLEKSILEFNYIWVQYAFNQLSKEIVRIRLPKIGESFVLRPLTVAGGNYAMLDRTVVQVIDSQTLKITEDVSFGIDASAKIGIVNNKSNVWISKISGDYDPTIKIKGWGE